MKVKLLFGGVCAAWALLAVVHQIWNCAHVSACCSNAKNLQRQKSTFGIDRLYASLGDMPHYYPMPAESNALAESFGRVFAAYTNGSAKGVREAVRNVPCFVTNSSTAVFSALCHPFDRPFRTEFLMRHKVRDFKSVADFVSFIEPNLEVARFLGKVEVERGSYSGFLLQIDRKVLERLHQYQKKFALMGRSDLAEKAGRFIEEWQKQIEARDGFTRSYMWHQAKLQLCGVLTGKMTESEMMGIVRGFADGLISAGYVPKWLDEFTVENVRALAE